MLTPAGVDNFEDEVALDVARHCGTPLLLLLAVELQGLVPEVLDERVPADLIEIFLQLLDAEVRVGERVERLDKAFEIPVLAVVALRVLLDEPRYHLVDPAFDLLREVG